MAMPDLGISLADIEAGVAHELIIFFKTPTTIKHQGQLLHGAPSLAALVQRLLERIASLLDLLTDDPPPLPFHELARLAREVRIVADPAEPLPARWVDLERYSSTHGYKHPIGGIVGRVRYAGDLTPFLPWLTFGQWLHVGKNAAQGNGMYVVERVEG
jgi:CRISPR-associated endoribonuclease Cas6